jgi:ATP synthase F0 subunit b
MWSGAARLTGLHFLTVLFVSVAFAQAPNSPATPKPADDKPVREIYVPFEDLNVILDNDHQRVFLTREEYEELVKAAKSKPQTPAPHKVALIAAQYDGQLEDGRALISGQLTIEVMEDGLFALPLELAGVGIRSATLDGKLAPLSRGEKQQVMLLVQGKGLHKLELKLTAPLQTAAAQQTLQVTLPTQAETRLKEYAAKLQSAHAEAATIVEEARRDAERVREEIRLRAKSDADKLLANAERQIQLQTNHALEQIRREAVDLSVMIASKIIQRNLSKEDNQRLIDDALKQVENSRN